jgi:hypothetical protein
MLFLHLLVQNQLFDNKITVKYRTSYYLSYDASKSKF